MRDYDDCLGSIHLYFDREIKGQELKQFCHLYGRLSHSHFPFKFLQQRQKYFVAQWLAARSLSTLRRTPRGMLRMTRGRCGSLYLHRNGLAPSTPCRSPGALHKFPFREVSPIRSDVAESLIRR
jgi:hypothetical protein